MEPYEKVTYWLDSADYDLETAKAMLDTGRLLYVGFMCHQTVEKVLKFSRSKAVQGIAIYSQVGKAC